MTTAYPKRTLKKTKNREDLIDAANRLFATKGYQNTKLEEIAEKAGLHVQTLYKQFKSKDDLAIQAAMDGVNHLRSRFENASTSQSAFQSWREFIHDSVSALTPVGFGENKRKQLKSASSMMNDNYLLIVYSGFEDVLTEFLARDFQMDPKQDRLPRLVACMLWSGNEAAMKRCVGLDSGEDHLDDESVILAEGLAVVDEVERVFRSYVISPN